MLLAPKLIGAFALGAVISAAPAPGFGLTVSPAAVKGPPNSHAVISVKDSGTTPLQIRMEAVELKQVTGNPNRWVPDGSARAYVTMAPSNFRISKGETKKVLVTVRPRDGYQHSVAIAAVAYGNPRSMATLSAAVAAKYVITGKPNPERASIPAEHDHGGSWWLWLVLALAAMGAILGLMIRNHRRGEGSYGG